MERENKARAVIRARLTDRHGAQVGYCDIRSCEPVGTIPSAPEVITLVESGRFFFRDPRNDFASDRILVPSYREVTFDVADNFQLNAVGRKGGA